MALVNSKTLCFISLLVLFISKGSAEARILVAIKDKAQPLYKEQSQNLNRVKSKEEKLPLKEDPGVFFRGDKMSTFLKKGYGHLVGNVFIEHLDLTLESPQAYLFFDENKTIYKIQTFNPTKILKEKTKDSDAMQATCQEAYYYPLERKLTLTKEVKISRPQEVIDGDHIDYYLKTEEMKGKQVSGFLSSNKKKKSD